MKTLANIRRNSGRIAQLIIVLGMLTLNIAAQKSFNDFTLANLSTTLNHTAGYLRIQSYMAERPVITDQNTMEIEDWMTRPADWNKLGLPAESSSFENEISLEDWMLTPATWNTSKNEVMVDDVNFEEQEMILEDWMMNTNWSENTRMEEELELESWMFDAASW